MSMTEMNRKPVSIDEYGEAEIIGDPRNLTAGDEEIIEHLRKHGYKIDCLTDRLRVKANAFVGHVTFEKFDLVVRPKMIPLQQEVPTGKSGEKSSPLATLLAYAFCFDNLHLIKEQVTHESFFADILVSWLLSETRKILSQGPYMRYQPMRRELGVLRGKIDLLAWIQRGGIPSATIPCRYYQRSHDNALNRAMLAGLRMAGSLVHNVALKGDCRFLAEMFAQTVTEKRISRPLITAAEKELNRLNPHYKTALKMIKLLYQGIGGFLLGKKHENSAYIPGFFFNMNLLFERTLNRFFRENLPGFQCQYNKGKKIFTGYQRKAGILTAMNHNQKWSMRPDYLIKERQSGNVYVLDAKYYHVEPGNEPMGQLALYAMAFSKSKNENGKPEYKSTFLFPSNKTEEVMEEREEEEEWTVALHCPHVKQLSYEELLKHQKCAVTARPVNIPKLVRLVMGSTREDEEERKRYAHYLAMGK